MRSIASRAFIWPALAILTGCSYNQVSAQGTTPIPQSLAEAAERTSQSTMALADIMARAHGESVRSVSLEVPSTGIPEFLKQRVRLDYNGPQEQVLDRIATDTGYSIVEYNEPGSGIGWQPWVRLSGDKPLIQHFKEMNSQSPWHLVMDHRDRRIIVDYSADGSMATQVTEAQRALNNAAPSNRSRANLPDVTPLREEAAKQISSSIIPVPESSSRQAEPVRQEATTQQSNWKNDSPAEGAGYWHALVAGYGSKSRAHQMEEWIEANRYQSMVIEQGDQYDVHVPATDDGQAANIVKDLKNRGVPAEVKYRSSSARSASVATTPKAATASPVTTPLAPAYRDVEPSRDISSTGDASPELDVNAWYVQTAFLASSSRANRAIEEARFDHLGNYDAYPLKGGWAVRIGPMESREQAISTMRKAREGGVSDAYVVKGRSV